jgi:hypothetical protein
MTNHSELPTANTPVKDINLETELREILKSHFEESHRRVPEIYQAYFSSPRMVIKRHWQHKKDIPKDLLTLPKTLFQATVGKLSRSTKLTNANWQPTGKEQALLAIIQEELLQMTSLQRKVQSLALRHSPEVQAMEAMDERALTSLEMEKIEAFLRKRLDSYAGPREGGRDLLLFMRIGIAGKGIGQKVTFGSAMATGAAIAQSTYIAHQSFWSSLWIHWAGTPAWVSAAGAVGGLSATLLLAPVLSPMAEIVVNRVRGEKHLHQILNQLEDACLEHKLDRLDFAGILASYIQVTPDLLQFIRTLRP